MKAASFNAFVADLESGCELKLGAKTNIEFADPDANRRSFSILIGGEKRFLVQVSPYPYER